MSFWTAVVIIVAIGALSQIFQTKLKAAAKESKVSVDKLSQRVDYLENRIGNLETIIVDKERIQKFSEL